MAIVNKYNISSLNEQIEPRLGNQPDKHISSDVLSSVRHKLGLQEDVGTATDFKKIRKQFDRNEDRNAHSENAVLIAKHCGSEEDHKEAKDILAQHKKLGYLSGPLSDRRTSLYKKLKPTSGYKAIFPEESPLKEGVSADSQWPETKASDMAKSAIKNNHPRSAELRELNSKICDCVLHGGNSRPHVKAVQDILGVKEEAGTLAKQIDTTLSNIASGQTGEIYNKNKKQPVVSGIPTGTSTHIVAGKDGDSYNTAASVNKKNIQESVMTDFVVTKRNMGLEDVISKISTGTRDIRKMYAESMEDVLSGNVSDVQRNDWIQVEQGKMPFMDYVTKYKN